MIAALELWAKEGGLIGMVIVSLFSLIGFCVHALVKNNRTNQGFIKELLTEDKEERKYNLDQQNKTYDRLAGAINELTSELRREHPE